MELQTNQLQAAADAGAIAGASELMHSNNTNNASSAAYNDVVQVTAANGLPAPSLSGQLGSTFGFYVNDNSVVEVQLTQNVRTMFLGLISNATSSLTLSVKADAQMPPCMLFMGNPTAYRTYDFWIASSAMYDPIGCPTYYKDGLLIDGFASVQGSQVRTSGSSASSTISGWASYAPIYSAPVLPDPLAYITTPAVASNPTCTNTLPIQRLNQLTSTTINLTPGIYCGRTGLYIGSGNCNVNPYPIIPAIDIQGTQMIYNIGNGSGCPNQSQTNGGNCLSTPTVNFAPGLYVIIGGFNFNCVTVTGNGVTLYFTKSLTVGYAASKLISSTWNLNAPTVASGGSIAGISIINDRNWTPSGASSFVGTTEDFQFTYSTYNADGVIYLTGTGFNAYGLRMSAPNYLNMVVASMYNYQGYVTPSTNYANLPAGNPLRLYPTLVQ